jgi:hypothetical protein
MERLKVIQTAPSKRTEGAVRWENMVWASMAEEGRKGKAGKGYRGRRGTSSSLSRNVA